MVHRKHRKDRSWVTFVSGRVGNLWVPGSSMAPPSERGGLTRGESTSYFQTPTHYRPERRRVPRPTPGISPHTTTPLPQPPTLGVERDWGRVTSTESFSVMGVPQCPGRTRRGLPLYPRCPVPSEDRGEEPNRVRGGGETDLKKEETDSD